MSDNGGFKAATSPETQRDDDANVGAKSLSPAGANTADHRLTPFEALELVCDLASQEWQEPDGSRRCTIDNTGERQWLISAAVMREARAAVAKAKREVARDE